MHFARNYAKALEQIKEAYRGVEKSNQELNEMNQRLKNTLSLLEEKNKELNAAIKTRELFIAGVSHEFRNPLNSLLGNIELLSLEIKNPKWKEMLATCKICGDVLLGLMNNILDVAKINAEKLELSIQSVNFYRLIETVWNVSAIKMREKGLKGQLSLAGNLPQYLEVDSHRLNQILLNVIGNATKFTSNGFVKVIISWHKNEKIEDLKEPNHEYLNYIARKTGTSLVSDLPGISNNHIPSDSRNYQSCLDVFQECPSSGSDNSASNGMTGSNFTSPNRQILKRIFSTKTLSDVRSSLDQIVFTENDKHIEDMRSYNQFKGFENPRKRSGILKIEVIDTGCGISPSALEKIFQPFTQADSSITRRFGGTGLGLYISKQLVQKMGGQMYAYSEENCGTNFCILIPSKSATAQEIDEVCAREANACDRRIDTIRALIVDDIPLNQTFMSQYMRKLNIEADIANNGAEAVEKFREKGFGYYSCIFMDIQMPVMDGMTASKKIRESEARHDVTERIPIIMVTGNCTEMEKNYCLDPEGEIKASYFFRKPFVFEECKSCVKSILASQGRR